MRLILFIYVVSLFLKLTNSFQQGRNKIYHKFVFANIKAQKTSFRFAQVLSNLRVGKQEKDFYRYYSYPELVEQYKNLAQKYPNLIKVETSQQKFKLPKVQCENIGECETHILTITNFQNQNKNKPWVYISGALHGNERVGPNVAMELAILLLENFETNQWVNYLMNNRVIVLTPTTNAQGYHENHREERFNGKIQDPNRDFPYLVKNGQCLQSVSGKTIYHLFSQYPFSMAITFHAGETSITYPWGAPNHVKGKPHDYEGGAWHVDKSELSPDDIGFKKLVNVLRDTASSNSFLPQYMVGSMTDQVYSVEGGMEDWVYGVGWENQHYRSINQTEKMPLKFDCELLDKTQDQFQLQEEDFEQIKTSIILIETSDSKAPPESQFGIRSDNNTCIFQMFHNPFQESLNKQEKNKCKQMDGHISRNLRLCLTFIDLAAPYINIFYEKQEQEYLDIKWKVGGALEVNLAQVYFGYFDHFLDLKNKLKQIAQFKENIFQIKNSLFEKNNGMDNVKNLIQKTFQQKTEIKNGFGVWNIQSNKQTEQIFTKFNIRIPKIKNKIIGYIIMTQSDQNFGDELENPQPNLPPQTYFVNQRIQKNFHKKFQKKIDNYDIEYISYYFTFSDIHFQQQQDQ